MSGPRADADEEDFRLSIAGAQEKTALLLHEGRWCAPHGATPTTHIFKLPLGLVGNLRADLHQSVELEWLCMEFVRECGLPVAETRIGRFEDQVALVVTRFDRELSPDGHWWKRIPQEDLCQAMGVAPSMKYEADGGPGTHAIMDLLRASVNAEEDRRHFFAAQLLFWILGATDGHAKNFSLRLLPRGEFRMTPLYDVLSTYPIQGRGPGRLDPRRAKMAMAVSGSNRHYRLHDIHRWHWVAMGERMGVPDPPGIVAETIARATTALERVASRLPEDFPAALPEAVDAGVKAALRRIGSEPDVRA